MRPAGVLLLLLGMSLGACAKSEPPAPAEPVPAATPTAPTPPVPTSLTLPPRPGAESPGLEDIATEEDFEADSAKAINAENLDAQLDALEKEILTD